MIGPICIYKSNLPFDIMEVSKQFEFTRFVLEEAVQNNDYANIEESLNKLRELAIYDSNAQFLMAEFHEKGLLERDVKKALKYYTLSAKNGHTEGAYRSGLLFEHAKTVKSPKEAYVFYKMAASHGHPGGCWKVGNAEMRGELGCSVNLRSACKWMHLSSNCATIEHPEGAYEYANMLEAGVENILYPDLEESLLMYEKAAELEHPKALMYLAQLYETGDPIKKIDQNMKLSISFYKKAAENGNTLACFSLSNFYLTGVEKALSADEQLAFTWMHKAARPFIMTEKHLESVEVDPTPRLKFLHSNNKKIPMAAYAIGYFYEMGVGCQKDKSKFIAWYKVAYQYGDMRGASKLLEYKVPLPKKKEKCKVM